TPATIAEVARATPVVDATDVLVVGGGPAGVSAAVAAARSGARVTLVERYPYLGGLASGGMVLVLDDMVNGAEITTTGLVGELIERLEKLGLAVSPPPEDRRVGWDAWRRWARWGCNDFRARGKPSAATWSRRCSGWATSTPTRRSGSSTSIQKNSRSSTARPSTCWAAPGTCGGSRRRCRASCGATARTWSGSMRSRSRT